ncbi:MAG: hypothetical protein IPP49_13250 [Saprospiraceae bacterium]|nr:hypothetical protein [Saprospiraceae bacterium]
MFVTDKNGCTATKYFNLRYVNPLKIEIEETKCVTGMPITPGNLKVTATGGLDNRYLWSDGSTSQNIPTTSAGTYTVSVSNDCGQSVSLSTVVTCTGTPPSAATVCIDILFISYDYTKEKLVVTLQDKSILPQGICTIKLQDNKTGGPSVFVNVTFEPGQNLYLIGLKRESLPNGSYSASITQNSQSCLALTPNMEISDPPSTTDNCYTNLLLDSKMLNYTTNKKGNEVEIIIIDENGKETKIKEKFSTSGTGVIDLSAYLSWSTYAIIINVSGCPEITISGSNFVLMIQKSIVYEPSEDKFIYFYTKSTIVCKCILTGYLR